jgi:hypothetical protein
VISTFQNQAPNSRRCRPAELAGLRKRLNAVAEGMIDLMEPFRRRDIYHWG